MPRILLVEDHADSATAFARLLERAGHHVRRAASLTEARAACAGEAFDLLVCDLTLPDGDGCDLMREMSAAHGIPGIAVTAHAYPADRRRSADAGFAAHLSKPFAFGALLEIIAQVIPVRGGKADGQADERADGCR